eukprot:TRINITY_DN50301_c0_g1_i1.p1 TRINITY_DN50301_c0_g1~~TRINITY_DN50301_c0_g1_i1.p1  ORF type:complete len:117 (-),score=16.61 TRINITY_DN50301_c0_g1_i1:100-450(-)
MLKQIAQLLPSFIAKAANADNKKNKVYLNSLGKYHLHNEYNLDEFMNMKGLQVFEGKQNFSGISEQCYVIISQINFLHFKLLNPVDKVMRLTVFYSLTQLLNMKRKKTDSTSLLFQ